MCECILVLLFHFLFMIKLLYSWSKETLELVIVYKVKVLTFLIC